MHGSGSEHNHGRRRRSFQLLLIALGCAAGLGLAGLGMALKVLPSPWRATAKGEIVIRPGQRRVMVIGDSFLAWWEIKECLHQRLNRWSEEHNIALNNTARGGYGPREYAERMGTIGPKFKPDLVLLFYYVGNDFTDEMWRPLDEAPRSRGTAQLLPEGWPDRRSELAQREAWPLNPLNWLTNRAWAAERKAQPEDFRWEKFKEQGIDPQLIEFARNRLRDPKIVPDQVNPYLLETALFSKNYIADNVLMEHPNTEAAKGRLRLLFRGIAGKARELGAELIVTVIPSTVQVSRSHYDFYRKCTFNVEERMLEAHGPQDFMRAICAENKWRMLDLLPAFKAAPNKEQLYWVNDDHLSEQGNTLAWEELNRQFLTGWEMRTRNRDRDEKATPVAR